MIISFVVFILVLSIFKVWQMIKKNLKKELAIFIFISLITLIYGIVYFNDPYEHSFVKTVLTYVNPNYDK